MSLSRYSGRYANNAISFLVCVANLILPTSVLYGICMMMIMMIIQRIQIIINDTNNIK